RATPKVDGFERGGGVGQVVAAQSHLSHQRVYKLAFQTQRGTEVEVAVVAGLLAEGNVE
nr:hypothetical protein [Tanacetum cinerariifolium]